jgi:hypothetical protein
MQVKMEIENQALYDSITVGQLYFVNEESSDQRRLLFLVFPD